MRLHVRDTELYFDVEGAGLVPDGPRMRERPVAFIIHGGPGGDHTGFKPAFSPLADTAVMKAHAPGTASTRNPAAIAAATTGS